MAKAAIKKFGMTSYSKDKEVLNAIVTSDSAYVPAKKGAQKGFKIALWIYAIIILFVTVVSLGLLGIEKDWRESHKDFIISIEIAIFAVLSADLLLRWYTSEVRIRKGNWSYFLFPVTITGLLLILSLLPSLATVIGRWDHSQIWKDLQNFKFLRIFRIILLANLVPGMAIFRKVLSKEKKILYTVFVLVLMTIFLFALVIYNVEGFDAKEFNALSPADQDTYKGSNQNIKSFWDALYFSTICLTTIGFGDISPVTTLGRTITMIMAIIGIAVLAIPSGVIAGGFISELKANMKEKQEKKAKKATKQK